MFNYFKAKSALKTEPKWVALDYSKSEIEIFCESKAEFKWRSRFCKKEPWTVQWLENNVRQNDVIFDIGANVGTVSLIAASLLSNHGQVYAFEPSYSTFSHLCMNIHRNKVSHLIFPVNFPLAEKTEMLSFHFKDHTAGQSRHKMGSQSSEDPNSMTVFSVSFDKFLELYHVLDPSLVKLDVDGSELQVLKGAEKFLKRKACRSLLIEVDEELTDPVNKYLLDLGYLKKNVSKREPDARVWYGEFVPNL